MSLLLKLSSAMRRLAVSIAGWAAPMCYQLPFDAKALAIFVAVVETRSMSDTAKKQAMTQYAISQAVKLLETELGITLLDRSMRPMRVMTAGNAVYASARRLPLLRCELVDSFASTGGPPLIKNIAHRAENLTRDLRRIADHVGWDQESGPRPRHHHAATGGPLR